MPFCVKSNAASEIIFLTSSKFPNLHARCNIVLLNYNYKFDEKFF